MSDFYIVERNGSPVIWQAGPEGIVRLLKRKADAGYSMAPQPPMKSRAEALVKLRELFPEARRARAVPTEPVAISERDTKPPRSS